MAYSEETDTDFHGRTSAAPKRETGLFNRSGQSSERMAVTEWLTHNAIYPEKETSSLIATQTN